MIYRFRTYATRLRALIAARHENPFAQFNHPWRSRRNRWRFRLAIYGSIAAAVGLGWMAYVMEPQSFSGVYCMFQLLATPAIALGAMWIFGHPHLEIAHLEELSLTSLRREEMAFGAVWGGALATAILLVPFYVVQVVACGVQLASDSSGFFPEWIFPIFVSPPIYVYCIALTAYVWISNGRSFLQMFLRLFILHFGHLILMYLLVAGMVVPLFIFWPETNRSSEWIPAAVLGAHLVGVVLYWVYMAGRFAGPRLFLPVDPDGASVSWMINETLNRKDRPPRRAALRRLMKWIGSQRRPLGGALFWTGVFLAIGGGLGLMGTAHGSNWTGGLRGAFGFSAILAAFLYSATFFMTRCSRQYPEGRLPIAVGSIMDTAMRYALLPCLSIVALLVIVTLLDVSPHDFDMEDRIFWIIGTVGIGVLGGSVAIIVVVTLLTNRYRRIIASFWILAGLLLHCVPVLDMSASGKEILFFTFEKRGTMTIAAMAILMLWMAVLVIPFLCQRLHERELLWKPRGTLSTDEPPQC